MSRLFKFLISEKRDLQGVGLVLPINEKTFLKDILVKSYWHALEIILLKVFNVDPLLRFMTARVRV